MEDKEEIFKEYASNYLDLSPLMKLKLNHTLRVEKKTLVTKKSKYLHYVAYFMI